MSNKKEVAPLFSVFNKKFFLECFLIKLDIIIFIIKGFYPKVKKSVQPVEFEIRNSNKKILEWKSNSSNS